LPIWTTSPFGSTAGPHRAEIDVASFKLLPVRRAGARGFLLNDATAAELIHAVRVVAAGGAPLASPVTWRLIADFARQPRPPSPPTLGALTHRETGALQLIAHGLSNTQISNTLIIAEQTTKPTSAAFWPNSASATASRPSSSPTKPASSRRASQARHEQTPAQRPISNRRPSGGPAIGPRRAESPDRHRPNPDRNPASARA